MSSIFFNPTRGPFACDDWYTYAFLALVFSDNRPRFRHSFWLENVGALLMTTAVYAAAVFSTVIWAIVVVAAFTASTAPPSEIWVATSSERVPTHPTLRRASLPSTTIAVAKPVSSSTLVEPVQTGAIGF
jgi:hypothetical protein